MSSSCTLMLVLLQISDGSLQLSQKYITRSILTVHTSAKIRLTSVAIRIRICIRIRDPDRHQNVIIYSLAHFNIPWKFHANPFGIFCSKLLRDRQTDKQTNKNDDYITFLAEIKNVTRNRKCSRAKHLQNRKSINKSESEYTRDYAKEAALQNASRHENYKALTRVRIDHFSNTFSRPW